MTKQAIALSAVQAEIYLDQLQDLDNPRYNIGGFIRLGAVDVERIASAHGALVRSDKVFGTRISADGLTQYVSEERTQALPLIDLSMAPDPAAAAWRHVDESFETPFALFDQELFRARLLKLHDGEFWYLGQAHHICLDGWGFANWAKRLSELYCAAAPACAFSASAAELPLRREPKPDDARLLAEQAYWRETLTGLPDAFLPGRPARRSGRWTNPLSTAQHANVVALAASLNASTAHVYSALVVSYLFAAYGQTDVVLAVPVHNRTTAAHKKMLGSFADVSVLRVGVEASDSFANLVGKIGAIQMRNMRAQRLPLAHHLRNAGLERGAGPIYQVAFNYVQLEAALAIGDANGQLVYCTSHHQQTPLSINICEYGRGMVPELQLDYNLGFFDAAEIALLGARLGHLLDSLPALAEQPLHQLDVMPAAERSTLDAWQNQGTPLRGAGPCLHALFERHAHLQPEAAALSFNGESLGYGELNRRANQLAHFLVAQGVGPDTRVAICIERGLDMVVGLLGILKAGGAYVPLDPAYPAERLAFILDDSAPALLLTECALLPRFTLDLPAVCLDAQDTRETLAAQAESDVPAAQIGLNPSHLAYVIYTSGSTGMPKGVLVEHRQVVRLFYATEKHFGFSNRDTWSLFHSFAFDFSVWEMWGALAYGGKAVIVPAACARSALDFYELVCAEGVTMLSQTPSAFKQFSAAQTQTQAMHALRCIVFGGEALEPQSLLPWAQRNGLDRTELINMYGITETTVHVTYHKFTQEELAQDRKLVGKPLDDLDVFVLDSRMRPVPIGIPGEFHVGGAGVARGYLNRPQLTAERFLSAPVGTGSRLYKTGDLGRWLPDGTLEYLGRNDSQVKIRGFRIELGEIEARLTSMPGVRAAAVVARADSAGEKRLVAYLVPHPGTALAAAELRAGLAATLPEHMLPSAFVSLDAFPLTPNGKLDHKALPAPGQDALVTRVYEAPQGELETLLAAVWQELLGLERVGRHDHFFELGGHSLLAVQVASRLRQALGVELPLRDLFAQPVLSRLAAVAGGAGRAALPALQRIDRNRALPASLAQQRLWLIAQLDPRASAAYHMPAILRLQGRLELAALRAALDRIVSRHEILRTTFAGTADGVEQRVGPSDSGFTMRFDDLRAVPAQAQDALVRQIGAEESTAPFDLATGPLARGRLVQLGDDRHIFFITLHHIVADGWSVGLLVKELAVLYRAFAEGRDDPLPPLPVQYADFAGWEQQSPAEDAGERLAAYWQDQLLDAPALLQLPTDRPRPAQQDYAGATAPLRLDAAVSAGLARLAQRQGATLFMALLATWAVLLKRVSGQDDIVIGTPMANRKHVALESLVGPFVDMLPLRVRLDAEPTTAQLLAQIKQTSLQAHAHQDLPFERIVEAVKAQRHAGHSPLFQTALLLDNTPAQALDLAGLVLSPLEPVFTGAKHDLSLYVVENGGCLDCTLVYSTRLFDHSTIEAFLQYWQGLVVAMCDNDDVPLSKLAVGDIRQLDAASLPDHPVVPAPSFVRFAPADIEQTIGERFAAQVQRHWDDPAVLSADRSLSYGQLYVLARQVAAAIAVDAADTAPVGLLLSHGEDMIVGILGALLAGRCYVPLDPEYPPSRLEFMARDSGMTRMITSAGHLPLAAQVASAGVDVVELERALEAHDPACSFSAWQSCATPDSAAYILYTSGSTGQPKGIVQNHRNALYFCASYTNNLAIAASDRVALLASFSFDAAVMDLFGALLNGACLVPIHPKALDAAGLVDHLAAKQVSIYHSTPTLYRHLFGQCATVKLPKARLVVLGGEPVSRTDLDIFLAAFPEDCVFVNGYGPTESTLAMQRFLAKPKARLHAPISAGHPIAGTTISLGRPGAPLHPFQSGEIYIQSGHVALRYHGRPELNASAFGVCADGVRYYRTGDIGRVMADGSIQIVGRADNQVKLRGIRIEPGEIEAQLKHCNGVRDAVVLLREDEPGNQRLVAYIVADEAWSRADALDRLVAILPSQMIPSSFVLVERIPLTPSGKVDRRALPAPVHTPSSSARPLESPAHHALADIWHSLLAVRPSSVDDDFFALGGHSLLAARLISKVRTELRADLVLRDVFESPTVESMSERITQKQQRIESFEF